MHHALWASCPNITPRSLHHNLFNRDSLNKRPRLISTSASTETTTERIFRSIQEKQLNNNPSSSFGAGGKTQLDDLRRLDAAWHTLKTKNTFGPRPEIVRRTKDPLPATPAIDVIVAGGTLGIFLASALQHAGLKVAVIERGKLQGRSQEWNISREELQQLVKLGVLSSTDLEECISIEFNPIRAGFYGYEPLWTRDVLNVGASPEKLVKAAAQRFIDAGGIVVDEMMLKEIWIHPNGIQVRMTGSSSNSSNDSDTNTNTNNTTNNTNQVYAIASKLLIDCMGNQSPIVIQVRHGQKPDGVCLVVGTCASGFDPEKNTTGDLIYTNSPSEPPTGSSPSILSSNSNNTTSTSTTSTAVLHDLQLFWEAFPAGSGDPTHRTTYMFTYLDALPQRPSLEALVDHYWHAMPEYQSVNLNDLEILRVLFGIFPTYKDSPLQTPYFDRIIAVGDASGMQSPLSFGGFAALTRHLHRLTNAIVDAVHAEAFDAWYLKFINPYNPSLSSAWMMQKAMSCPAGSRNYDINFINKLLGGNFKVMNDKGNTVLKPFLQDVIQVGPMMETLLGQMKSDPLFVPQIVLRVGPVALAEWLVHFIAMAAYTAVYSMAIKLGIPDIVYKSNSNNGSGNSNNNSRGNNRLSKREYILRRALERWQYGAGLDYVYSDSDGDDSDEFTRSSNNNSNSSM